jgi:type III secretion system FlhB-like substrate exporter
MPGDGSRKRRVLTDIEREVVRLLLHQAKGNKLPKNTYTNIAREWMWVQRCEEDLVQASSAP